MNVETKDDPQRRLRQEHAAMAGVLEPVTHPDVRARLKEIATELKHMDGERWAVGEMVERARIVLDAGYQSTEPQSADVDALAGKFTAALYRGGYIPGPDNPDFRQGAAYLIAMQLRAHLAPAPGVVEALSAAHFTLLNRSNATQDAEAWEHVATEALKLVDRALAAFRQAQEAGYEERVEIDGEGNVVPKAQEQDAERPS